MEKKVKRWLEVSTLLCWIAGMICTVAFILISVDHVHGYVFGAFAVLLLFLSSWFDKKILRAVAELEKD